MSDREILPPEATFFEQANGWLTDDMPEGEWHMQRFIYAYKAEKEAPETMKFLADAFAHIIRDLENSENTGDKNRDKILNRHLKITKKTRGPKKEGKKTKQKKLDIAMAVEHRIRMGEKKDTAKLSVTETHHVSMSTVEKAYRANKQHVQHMYDIVQEKA